LPGEIEAMSVCAAQRKPRPCNGIHQAAVAKRATQAGYDSRVHAWVRPSSCSHNRARAQTHKREKLSP
jgi:hypothetical protein